MSSKEPSTEIMPSILDNASSSNTASFVELATAPLAAQSASSPSNSYTSLTPADADKVPPNKKVKATSKRITNEAKKELFDLFMGPPKFPRNANLPRVGTNKALDLIISKYALTRDKAARQLRNFKEQEYCHSEITMLVSPDQIRDAINESLSLPIPEFVNSVLQNIVDCDEAASNSESIIFWRVIHDMKEGELKTVQYLAKNPEHKGVSILAELVHGFTNIAAEVFPNAAAQLPSSELDFLKKRLKQSDTVFAPRWLEIQSLLPTANELSSLEFGFLGMHLEACLFFEWSNASVDTDRPAIEFPAENLVSKYALPVVYYVAGWTLSSVSLAKLAARHKRPIFASFASIHCIGRKDAEQANLPISLVVRRQRKSLSFSNQVYFDFICAIESIYLHNLNLKMMIAYNDGDLLDAINCKIMEDDAINATFSRLYADVIDVQNVVNKKEVLKYILDRYINMRGCWFVRHMRGTQGGTLGARLVETAATRTKVAHAVATSKAVASSESEKDFWDNAAKNVEKYLSPEMDNIEH